MHAILDQSFAAFGLEAVLRDLILPTLTRVGLEWQQGTLAISQEHFASNLIRGRLLSLARLWGRGSGPLALLACAPGEQHDITLLCLRAPLALLRLAHPLPRRRHADLDAHQTAEDDSTGAHRARQLRPGTTRAEATHFAASRRRRPLVLSGPGASDALCTQLGVRRLDGDLVTAANEIARRPNG